MRIPVPSRSSQQTSGGGLSYSAGTENRYRYNGKELHRELGLGWYDYGARMYDPSIGRWNGVDASSEGYFGYGSYTYNLNNPILLIDLNGRDTYVYDENGEFVSYRRDDFKNQIHFVDRKQYEDRVKENIEQNLIYDQEGNDPSLSSVEVREMSYAFIGSNTVRSLREFQRKSKSVDNEHGGFLFNDSDDKELKVFECKSCQSGRDKFIHFDQHNNILPHGRIFAKWHSHYSGGGSLDGQPSRDDFEGGGTTFSPYWNNKNNNPRLYGLNGSISIIPSTDGMILHDTKGRTKYRGVYYSSAPSRVFDVFKYNWFDKVGGMVFSFNYKNLSDPFSIERTKR